MQRHPAAGDRGRAGAAVGLDDVAVDGDLALAERLEVDDGAQAAADQPLDLDRAAALLAGGGLAPRPLLGGARQHAVFGGDPAAGLALEPGRHAVLERRRHQHVGVAELHEAGALRVFDHPALEGDRAKLVGLAPARSHDYILLAAGRMPRSFRSKAFKFARSAPQARVFAILRRPRDGQTRPSGAWIRSMRSVSQDVPIGSSEISLAQLNERSREIFRQIVESYLATGEPVGSRNLSRIIPMTLSPASVRNVMQDLEQLGLIYAPHTSAGRLPTELGLRFFVDALMQIGDLSEPDRVVDRGPGRRRRHDGRERAHRGLDPALRTDPRRRRRAHRQGECPPEAHRVRAPRAGARAGRAGRRGRPGREPRARPADRAAGLGADRGVELPQRPCARQDARRGQGRARSRARSRPRRARRARPRRSSPPALRAGPAASATSAS